MAHPVRLFPGTAWLALAVLGVAACSDPVPPAGPPDAGSPVVEEEDAGDTRAPARLEASDATLAFGSIAVGTSVSREMTLSNLGEREIVLDNTRVRVVQADGRPFFTVVAPTDRTLAGGATSVWRIDYAPVLGGRDAASLQFDNDGTITTITLTGESISSESAIVLRSGQATLGATTSPSKSAVYTLEGSVGLGVEAVEMKNPQVKLRFGSR